MTVALVRRVLLVLLSLEGVALRVLGEAATEPLARHSAVLARLTELACLGALLLGTLLLGAGV